MADLNIAANTATLRGSLSAATPAENTAPRAKKSALTPRFQKRTVFLVFYILFALLPIY